jgi:hypothetical protein
MSASEVYDRVIAGELTWVSYVWKEGMAEWARIADVAAFKAAVPPPPAQKPKARPPAPPNAKKLPTREWFLFYNDSQYGPFTEEEVQGLANVGKITTDSFVWKDGMSDWEKIGSLAHFASFFKDVVAKTAALEKTVSIDKQEQQQKRAGQRKPILAKVIIAEGDQILIGMGRDISIGGMQVLSEFLPTKVGSRLKLNVSPPEPNSGTFTPFVAEGVVVRVLEDRRGFSFRFDELSANARQIIERIVAG